MTSGSYVYPPSLADESVQFLDLLLAIFLVSDDVCWDLELLLEHVFESTQIFDVGGRHEVVPVDHHQRCLVLGV